jgi:hypothetical protein
MQPTQADRPGRRFGLGDGLIVMAALAVALALLRSSGWFGRIPLRVDWWWETSLALLRLRPWNMPVLTRRQAAPTVLAQVIAELPLQFLSSVLCGLTLERHSLGWRAI